MSDETRTVTVDEAWWALAADLNNNVGFGAGPPSALVHHHRPLIEAALAALPVATAGPGTGMAWAGSMDTCDACDHLRGEHFIDKNVPQLTKPWCHRSRGMMVPDCGCQEFQLHVLTAAEEVRRDEGHRSLAAGTFVDAAALRGADAQADGGEAGLREAALFMLELVDQYYGTDHEFDIPEEAEFRRHRAVIEGSTPDPHL